MADKEISSKKRVALDWGMKGALACLPALFSSYFAMREAKIRADIEIATINAKAGAGYEVLKDAVQKMKGELDSYKADSQKLMSLVEILEARESLPVTRRIVRPAPIASAGSGFGSGAGRLGGSSAKPRLFSSVTNDLDLPANLDVAADVAAQVKK